MKARSFLIVLVLIVLVALAVRSFFIVGTNEYVVLSRFGKIERADFAPGLQVRWPFETAQHLDRRLVLQTLPGENVISSEKKSLIVDLLVRWRIKDPVAFVKATDGNEDTAGQQLGTALSANLKTMFSERTLAQIVGADSASLTSAALAQAAGTLAQLGVAVQDVSLQSVELPDDLRAAVYQRMQAQFQAQAKQIRADAAEALAKSRADTEQKRVEIYANATRDAQRIRGEGEAQAALVYARGYGKNVEFGAFYRSLQAYRTVLGREGDILVIQPDGDFFKYLHSSGKH
jgi:modulator of FtsH protease HflC